MFVYTTVYSAIPSASVVVDGWMAWGYFCRDVLNKTPVIVKKIEIVCGDLIVAGGQVSWSEKFGFSYHNR